MTWNDNIAPLVRAAAATGLHAAAEHVIAETIPLTPLLDGDLRSSIVATDHTEGDGTLAAVISSDRDYAVAQHEEIGWQHSEPGTGAKFLERGVHAAAPDIPAVIAGPIRKALS